LNAQLRLPFENRFVLHVVSQLLFAKRQTPSKIMVVNVTRFDRAFPSEVKNLERLVWVSELPIYQILEQVFKKVSLRCTFLTNEFDFFRLKCEEQILINFFFQIWIHFEVIFVLLFLFKCLD